MSFYKPGALVYHNIFKDLLRFGIFEIQRFEGIHQNRGDEIIAKPFVVGRNDIPGSIVGGGLFQGIFKGILVLIP